jgi:hypothetical protein
MVNFWPISLNFFIFNTQSALSNNFRLMDSKITNRFLLSQVKVHVVVSVKWQHIYIYIYIYRAALYVVRFTAEMKMKLNVEYAFFDRGFKTKFNFSFVA